MKLLNIFSILTLILVFADLIYPQTSYTIQASNFKFNPSSVTIFQGDTVNWVWVEGTHTTTSNNTTGAGVWNSPLDQSHTSFSRVFNHTGVFSYYCVYHRSIGMVGTITVESPASVKLNNPIADSYNLEQNYPNPFNPTTEINYSLPKSSFVNISVYNLLGDKVSTLINRKQSAGKYSVEFNAGNLPSGVYFYSIQAGNFSDTKKLVLLK